MREIWKDIKGYEGRYQVSTFGRIYSLPHDITMWNGVCMCTRHFEGRIRKDRKGRGEYRVIGLWNGEKYVQHAVHRLVADAFIPNPDNLPQINHKDENPRNNRVDNLERVSAKDNSNYGTRNERMTATQRKLHKSRPVVQMTRDGTIIAHFTCVAEASKQTGVYRYTIQEVCMHRGHHITAGGYRWKLVDE